MIVNSKAALLPLWAIAGLHLWLACAQAQTAAPAAPQPAGTRADPADPKVQVPAALYTSPLRAYKAFTEPQLAPWRDTNERVQQRGGWRAYAREAREAREPDAARPASNPASGGHAGHEMK